MLEKYIKYLKLTKIIQIFFNQKLLANTMIVCQLMVKHFTSCSHCNLQYWLQFSLLLKNGIENAQKGEMNTYDN
jgi:hypothetical protein